MKIHVERVRLDRGGYDRRGRYWGVGQNLYRVSDDDRLDKYVRAASAREAREKVTRRQSRDSSSNHRDSKQYVVFARDGRIIGHITENSPDAAYDRLLQGKRYGTYDADAQVGVQRKVAERPVVFTYHPRSGLWSGKLFSDNRRSSLPLGSAKTLMLAISKSARLLRNDRVQARRRGHPSRSAYRIDPARRY